MWRSHFRFTLDAEKHPRTNLFEHRVFPCFIHNYELVWRVYSLHISPQPPALLKCIAVELYIPFDQKDTNVYLFETVDNVNILLCWHYMQTTPLHALACCFAVAIGTSITPVDEPTAERRHIE